MFYQQMGDTIAVRLQVGEEIVASLTELCERLQLHTATIAGLGAVNRVTCGLFDPVKKSYLSHHYEQDLEIVSLVGNITRMQQKPYLHLHASFADEQGRVFGGHLNEAWISATAELFITVLPGQIGRFADEQTGLNLMEIG